VSAAIGIDIGGTKLLGVRMEDGNVVEEYRTVTPDVGSLMVEGIVAAAHKLDDGDMAALGVGVAGLVDHSSGKFVWGPHVDGVNVTVRDGVQAELNIPVSVDNDANTAALAEHRRGAGRGSDAMLMLTLGTGIGGAMVFAGELYRGRGFAGEFGHARFGRGANQCECGQVGCWETEAAGPALERLARRLIASDPGGSLALALEGGHVSGPAVSEVAAAGDEQARELITEIGLAFGQGLASVISIFDPDRVVIGGGLGSVGELLLRPIRESANAARYAADHKPLPDIVGAQLGERAGAVGAALMAAAEAGIE